mmetsp:Transcript_5974/g.9129  ORF Transcript_5974/g.9129 Transcript_5974/m.9129 type:complete len:117 (-) Transcript_5974:2461-2811(-)
MQVDEQFMDWWINELKREPFPKEWVIPILKNLQGHPEAPRLWEKHINGILRQALKFQQTTHEPCVYHRTNQEPQLMLRQVDDFLVSTKTRQEGQAVRDEIQAHVTQPLHDLLDKNN